MCETLKPKVSGWASIRRLRSVDLPVPEGPDRTIGRSFFVEEGFCVVGAMVENAVVVGLQTREERVEGRGSKFEKV